MYNHPVSKGTLGGLTFELVRLKPADLNDKEIRPCKGIKVGIQKRNYYRYWWLRGNYDITQTPARAKCHWAFQLSRSS